MGVNITGAALTGQRHSEGLRFPQPHDLWHSEARRQQQVQQPTLIEQGWAVQRRGKGVWLWGWGLHRAHPGGAGAHAQKQPQKQLQKQLQ